MGTRNCLPPTLKSLIDLYQRPFVLVDRKFNIVAANAAYAQQYGLRPEDVVGRKCHQVSHKSERPCAEHGEDCPHRRMFMSGQMEEAVHVHFRPDGSSECVEIKAHPILGEDGQIAYMGEELKPIAKEDVLATQMLIGRAPRFLSAISEANMLASVDIPVLIYGESGVGKEQLASYLHKHSPRAAYPFVTLDCCGLSETLFESELFGHEAGAFTDAHRQKKGLFELAQNGTLFLDEVGEISPIIQAKLLRVIETGTFRRVGGTKTLHADVRIVSATNRKLTKLVAAGDFRHDLYFRLAGHTITLPPLRERKQDIPLLVCFFLKQIEKSHMVFAPETLDILKRYNFPGNVRELKYLVELSALRAGDSMRVLPEHLPEMVTESHMHGVLWQNGDTEQGSVDTEKAEQTILGMPSGEVLRALEQCRGSRREAARLLGISERKMYRLIRKFRDAGMEVPPPYQS